MRLPSNKKQVPTGYTGQADFVFILGMHRSGTSCLAGSLECCGLFLGEANRRKGLHNAQGTLEIRQAVQIHNQILRANGGSWHKPPARAKAKWHQKWALQKIAKRLSKQVPCGLKDPRLLLLLDIWTEFVDSYSLIGTFRHPAAVARSLAQRHHIQEEKTYSLWLTYNTKLVQWHKRYHFPIIEFDLTDAELYCQTVASAASALGLLPNMDRLHQFAEPRLDHCSSPKEPVPAICQETYVYLQQHRCLHTWVA